MAAPQVYGQETRGPARPESPTVERPDGPTLPQAPEVAADNAPAADASASDPTTGPAGREPVTYWDDYQRALDEAEAEPAPEEPAPADEEPDSAAAEAPPLFDDEDLAPRSFQDNLLRVIFWLCILMAAFLSATYLIRTLGQRARLIPADSLASIIGRIYLAPRYSLHFVRTGGRVLVVGITPTSMNLIAEFDDDAFPGETPPPASNGEQKSEESKGREKAVRFIEELKQHQRKMAPERTGAASPAASGAEDEEIVSLRGDIARLQQLLRDSANDPPR